MVETFKNSKGEVVESASLLNEKEVALAERLTNAISEQYGYLVPMTTLTAVLRDVAEQKFYQIPVADYLPVRVGTEAAWADDILMFRSFQVGGDFEKGYIETANEGRLASTDAALDAIRVKARVWAKELNWSIADVAKAARSGVWDLVTQKEKSRRTNWDLGIQKTAFLGSKDGTLEGLATLSDVTVDSGTLIPASISAMSDAQFQAFAGGIIGAYQTNNNFTAMPNRLYIPQTDYVALATATSVQFPIKSKIEYLRDVLKAATNQQDFEIKPLAYLQVAQSDGKLSKDRYILMRYDEDVARFEIPVDYTVTVPNSIEGFTIRNVGYGQHSGVLDARPQEILYMDKA
jgi:hypothetical protein